MLDWRRFPGHSSMISADKKRPLVSDGCTFTIKAKDTFTLTSSDDLQSLGVDWRSLGHFLKHIWFLWKGWRQLGEVGYHSQESTWVGIFSFAHLYLSDWEGLGGALHGQPLLPKCETRWGIGLKKTQNERIALQGETRTNERAKKDKMEWLSYKKSKSLSLFFLRWRPHRWRLPPPLTRPSLSWSFCSGCKEGSNNYESFQIVVAFNESGASLTIFFSYVSLCDF